MNRQIARASLLTLLLAAGNNMALEPSLPGPQLYFGGDILTMAGDEPQYAEALVVDKGNIIFVGSRDEARQLVGISAFLPVRGALRR